MFESLSDRLGKIFEGLRGRGALNAADVDAAMREIRRALIEADVSLEVVRAFVEQVRERAVGAEVTRSVTPGQQVVKIVNDELVAVLGSDAVPIDLNAKAPVTLLMVGLQGSGKTTTTAKIAKRLTERNKKKVLLASLDTRRPAAMEQLRVLGEQVGVDTLAIVTTETPVQIARRAEREARLGGYDVLILDTAGRTHIDEELMAETAEIKAIASPHEILLVVDALTGQDAINVARSFDSRLDVTGIVMTRVDGDGRGGAALSMRAATGKPIKLIGVGEKMDALEDFHPSRIADRILGMGDIVSLVEKAAEHVSAEDAQKMARKLKKGSFDLDDLRNQLIQMKKMGGMGGLMGMLPGAGQLKKAMANSNVDEKVFDRQIAIINSMTKKERANPDLLNASRRKRIAAGAGVEVSEINKLAKQHRQMADMMKKVGKGGMGALGGMFGGKMGNMLGGMPDMSKMDPAQLEAMARQAGIDPNQLKGLPSVQTPQLTEKLPSDVGALLKTSGSGLPGLGGVPRFPGLPGLGKKK
ncbi:MAG: signal recognition particle protein [Alphaproteobacteria bacterium]|jgi:signal recognition particle subunit SRP54|uniref:signal recognition particle protein n=1 Tax=Devosia sp. XGJD_8 TaxID=3391187 RepID=UPI001D3B4855|nr:signal recognition particle protein [Alphaproteobacteria bacterium]MBU1561998.1 signal recognition particle protein [Alphaproteobacteria bacterium]MBU2301699.1 signal recognition particle protein [Alphaproteobacteria bacterium]MBU2369855.1 signal recognition particle protein [Alphaproteobacteria bacterium]